MSAARRQRFEQFHAAHPDVYDRLATHARKWKRRHPHRQSIAMLFEVLRYEEGLSTTGDPFKLDNSLRPFYARLLMDREPDLAGLFETRGHGGRDPFGHRVHPAQERLWPESTTRAA